MFYIFRHLLWLLMLGLAGCSDKEPATSRAMNTTHNVNGQLRLEIPSLLGWGEISEITMTIGDTIEFLATLEDNTGKPISGESLLMTSRKGNIFTQNMLLTDHNGQATSLLVAGVPGEDQITVDNKGNLSAVLSITVINPDEQGDEEVFTSLEELPDVVSWKTLAKVTLKGEAPYFDVKIKALQGQKIKVQGFMLPLEQV